MTGWWRKARNAPLVRNASLVRVRKNKKIAATFAGGGDNIFVEIVILKTNNLKFPNHSIINQNELESARLRNENFQLILL